MRDRLLKPASTFIPPTSNTLVARGTPASRLAYLQARADRNKVDDLSVVSQVLKAQYKRQQASKLQAETLPEEEKQGRLAQAKCIGCNKSQFQLGSTAKTVSTSGQERLQALALVTDQSALKRQEQLPVEHEGQYSAKSLVGPAIAGIICGAIAGIAAGGAATFVLPGFGTVTFGAAAAIEAAAWCAIGGAIAEEALTLLVKQVLQSRRARQVESEGEDESEEKPSKKDCNTAKKLLRDYERLAEKIGSKLTPKRIGELNEKRDAGIITSYDLPGGIQKEFPGKLKGKTLKEIEQLCGKS
ncbi:hypothetical protein NIES4074_42560 [Cylindrospermum sp. NIES-4074]|nr:hypothetical protein NIES4074_42560 [Cylindrospermum sp. NIES-4074]